MQVRLLLWVLIEFGAGQLSMKTDHLANIAQLEEHLTCNKDVKSSILFVSSKFAQIAQLDSAADFYSAGWEFESLFGCQHENHEIVDSTKINKIEKH